MIWRGYNRSKPNLPPPTPLGKGITRRRSKVVEGGKFERSNMKKNKRKAEEKAYKFAERKVI